MKVRIFLAIFTLGFLAACNGMIEIGIEHTPDSPVSSSPTTPVFPSPTPTSITAGPTNILPAPTLLEPTKTQVPPADTPGPQMVQIFLIGMEDNGQTGTMVGCGDSAIPVQVEIVPTQGVLKAALESLLSIKDQYYGQSGLYNALYQSDLQVESVSINNGKAAVYLTGSLLMGGECDNPRVKAQIEETVLQFPTVTAADIFINGKPLADVLSLK